MHAEFEELDILVEMQAIDLAVIQAKKARAELPQRIEVVKVRKKRDEISPKLEQVCVLQQAKEAEITAIEDEDRSLADRQERAQADIDNASSDYRSVESHSKDMAGIVKRRIALEEQLGVLKAEHVRILDIREQLEQAIEACDAKEQQLRMSYKEEDDALIERVRNLLAKRSDLAAKVSAEVVSRYEDTAKKMGGVALGKLEDGRCGVCRSVIDGGRLIELRAQAPLGICPNCKRLLIVEE